MKRDAKSTRQRILEAATVEFSQYGIAGARIDRIAAAASSNKSMIYTYYHSKDGLFDAVFDALIGRNLHDVPITAHDLPEYAARLFDQYQKYPEVLRLGTWALLERGTETFKTKAMLEANEHKINEIRKAQLEGTINTTFSPAMMLMLLLALTHTGPNISGSLGGKGEIKKRREAIQEAVRCLIKPVAVKYTA
jgi:AcrR family transcriptional regulator